MMRMKSKTPNGFIQKYTGALTVESDIEQLLYLTVDQRHPSALSKKAPQIADVPKALKQRRQDIAKA